MPGAKAGSRIASGERTFCKKSLPPALLAFPALRHCAGHAVAVQAGIEASIAGDAGCFAHVAAFPASDQVRLSDEGTAEGHVIGKPLRDNP